MSIKFNANNKSKQCFTDKPNYTVKNVKSFMGREGYGFECSLYKDGKKIGTVTDTAGGGMTDFYLDDGEEKILDDFCLTLPKWGSEYGDNEYDTSSDIFLSNLVEEFEVKKKLKKDCKTKTLVKVMKDGKEQIYIYKCAFSEKIKTAIKTRDYPDTDIVFVNETI